jgi:ribosomal protein S18 acetylase RimI-like enzyme
VPLPEVRALAENLLEAMRFFGRARKGGEVLDTAKVCLISCGLNYAAFNAAILAEPVGPRPGELQHLLQLSANHYESRRMRWTYWLCDDYLPPLNRETRALFQRFGLAPLTEPPGLLNDHLLPPRRPLPNVDLRRVQDAATRAAFSDITGVVFDIPHDVCNKIYGSEAAWKHSFEGYVGYSAGVPVATAAAVITGDVVGVYSVGTLPQSRRRGYAEAVMRRMLADIKDRTGIETSVLQATHSGLSLYQQMGYKKVTRFSVYIS